MSDLYRACVSFKPAVVDLAGAVSCDTGLESGGADLLLLTRAYIKNPDPLRRHTLDLLIQSHYCQHHFRLTELIERLQAFVVRFDQSRPVRSKFRCYAAREYLIQFTRPSHSTASHSSRLCRAGALNSGDASTPPLYPDGSHSGDLNHA